MNDRSGTVTTDGEHAVITFVRRLPHPVETVWSALTDPDQRGRWFGATTVEPREGGLIEMTAAGPPVPPEHRRMTGRILVWDPPHVLEHEWRQPIVADSVVRYELTRDEGGTLLQFTHRGLAPTEAQGFTPGTHAYLDRLEAHLDGAPLPNWQRRYNEVAPIGGGWA